ncbi:hypothetical protein [Anaerobiospirillum sp. NML120449]|uniref:hypothetical protein n=1 Tax=Anaerobiospirillum sp. NML120449 TaxID=2932817 RepID=UPI001FF2236B|nr:hypothetical protein [Anaerobiospirillum sp. NML120449]MCK0526844.1 hypothetical protein [Anaerobiospirillum sp. NML120449]
MHFIEDHFIPGEGHNSSAQTTFLPDGQITCHQKNRNANRLKGRLPVRPDADSDIPMSLACYLELCEKRNPADHTHDAEQQLTAEPAHASALAASNDLRPRCSQPKANARTATSSKTSKNLKGSQSKTMTQPKQKATTKAKAKSPSRNHPMAQAMVYCHANAHAEAQDYVASEVISSGIPSGCASCCESGGHKDHSGSADHASSKAPNSLSGRKVRKPHSCSNAPDATSGSNTSKTRSGSKAKTSLHSSSKPKGPKATAIPSDVQEKAIAMLLALAKEPAPAQSCISAQTVSDEDCLLACSDRHDDSVTASRNSSDSSVGACIDCGVGTAHESSNNDGLDDSCDGVARAEHDHLNEDEGHHPSASMQQDAHDADSHAHGHEHEHEPEHKQALVHDNAEATALKQEEKQSCSAAQVNSSSDSISVDDGSNNISDDVGHDSSEESADCAEHESRMDESSPEEVAQPAADADKSGDKSSLVDGAACSDAPGEAQGGARGKYLTYEQHLASDPERPNSTRKIFKGYERAVADSLYSLDIDSLMIHRSLQHLELAVDALEDGTASESELKMAGRCGTLARVLMEHCDHLASWPELSEALYQLLSDRSVLNAASFESSGDLARLCELAPGPEWPRHSVADASGDSDSYSTAAQYALSNLHSMADLGVDTSEYLETMLTRILTARHLPERRALFESLLHEINTRQSRHELKTDNYHPESGQPSAKATGGSSCGTAGRSGSSSKLRNGTDADDCGGIVEAGVDTDSALADQSGIASNAAPEQAAPARPKSPARLPGSCDYDLINYDNAQSTADDAVGLADNASDDGSSNDADAYSKPDADAACATACTADAALAGSGSGQHSSQYSQSNAPAGALYKSLLCNEGNIASLGEELCAQQDELSTDTGSSSCTDSQDAWAIAMEPVKQAGTCNETDKTTQTAYSYSTDSNTGRTGNDDHECSDCSSISSNTSKPNSKGKGHKHGKGQDHDHSQSPALLAANNDHADSETERTLGGNSVSEIEVEGEVEIERKSCCSQGNDSAHVSGSSSTACTDTDCAAGADSGYGCNEGSDSDCDSAIASSKGTFWWDEIIGGRSDRHRTRHSAESSVDNGAGAAGKGERCSARAAGLIDDANDEQLIISSLIRAFNSSLGTEGGPHDKRARKVYKSALEEATLATCDVVHLNGVFSQPDNALECMLRACTASLSSRRAAAVITSNPGSGGAACKGVRRPGAVPADALATTTVPAEAKALAKAHAQARSFATGEIEITGTSGATSASSDAQVSLSVSASSSASTAAGPASGITAQAAHSESMLAHAGLTCANDSELSNSHGSWGYGHGHNDGVAAAADSDESRQPSQALDTSSSAGLNHLAEGKCLTSRTFWQTIKSRKSRSQFRTGAYSHAQLTSSMTEAANGSSHVAAAPYDCAGSAAPAASGCAAGHGFDGNEAGTIAGSDAGLGTATDDSTGTWKKAGTDYADPQATGVHRLKSQHASTQPADACSCSSVAADSRKAGRTSSHGRSDARELQMLALALSMKGMTSEEVSYFLPRLACELPCGQVQHSWSGQVIHSADEHNKAWSHETAGYGSGTGTGGGADAAAWTGGSNMGMSMDSSMLRELLADNTISGQRRSMSAELTHPVSKMALDNMIRLYFAFHRDQGLLYSERYVLSCEGGESERMQSLIFADSFIRAGGLAMASISHEDGHITVTLNTVSATDDLPDLQVQAPQHSSTACTTEHDTDRQSHSHGRTMGTSATSSTSNSNCNINGGQDHEVKDTDTGNSTGTGSDAVSATDYATASDTKAASAKASANAPSIASASSPATDEHGGVSCEQSTDTTGQYAVADSCSEGCTHYGSDGAGSDSHAETGVDASADAGSDAASGPENAVHDAGSASGPKGNTQESSDSTGPDSGDTTGIDTGADAASINDAAAPVAGTGSNDGAHVAADAGTGADNGPDAVADAAAAKGSSAVAQPANDANEVAATEACSDDNSVAYAGDDAKATHDAVSTCACTTAEGYADQVKTCHDANETETAAESGDDALTAAVDTDAAAAAASSTVSKSTGKRGRKAKAQSSASSKNQGPADSTAEDAMAAGHADSRSDQCQSSDAECGSGAGSESCCEPSIKTSSAGKDAKSGRGQSHGQSNGHGNGHGSAGLGSDDGQHQGGRFSEGLEELIEVLNVATVDGHRMGLYSLADYRRRPAMRALYDYLCSCEYDEHAASNMGSWDWNGGRQSYGGCDRYRDLNRLDLLSMLSAKSALSRDGGQGSSGGPAGGLAALAAGIAPKGRTPAVKWLPLCVHALVSHKKLKRSAVSAQSRLNALRSQQTRDRERGHCGAINIPWALAVHDMYCHLADRDASDERNAPKGSLIPGADDNEKMGIFRRYRLPQIAVLLRCLDQLRHGHAFMFRCSCGHETFICDGAYNRLSGTEQVCPFCGSAISFTS